MAHVPCLCSITRRSSRCFMRKMDFVISYSATGAMSKHVVLLQIQRIPMVRRRTIPHQKCPLVMTNSLLLNMAIEIVSFPLIPGSMVIFHIFFRTFRGQQILAKAGKPWFFENVPCVPWSNWMCLIVLVVWLSHHHWDNHMALCENRVSHSICFSYQVLLASWETISPSLGVQFNCGILTTIH